MSGRSRLQKILAAAGLGSRRAVEQFLRDGRVTVNGSTAILGDSADPAVDVIAVDGEKLSMQSPSYWVLHKPVGVVTTMSDPEGRPTVADLLPPKAAGVFPVGRLDVETTGLVLLTNDGAMAQTLLHPSTGGEKEYRAVLKGELTAKDAARLERGITLEDGRTKPAKVEEAAFDADRGVTRLKLVLTEGRNRQIRRMMMAIGRPVKSLARTRIGPLTLGRLRRGEARPLRAGEVSALARYVERLRAGESPEIRIEGQAAGPPTVAKLRGSAKGRGRTDRRTSSRAKKRSSTKNKKGARPGRSAAGTHETTAGPGRKGAGSRKKGAGSPRKAAKSQSRVARKGTRRKKASRRPRRK